jgi:hypothetical protein
MAKNWQVFLGNEPGSKAGHASFRNRNKTVRVYDRPEKIDKEMLWFEDAVLKFDSSSGLYTVVDIREVFRRVGSMQARKTGHEKLIKKNCLSCTRENKVDKKLCQGQIARLCGAY